MLRLRRLVLPSVVLPGLLASLGLTACGGRRGDVLVRDGVEQARRGQSDEARQSFKKALAATPGSPGARTGLAALEKDPKKARALLDKELAAHPELEAARFDRALLALATGTPESAKEAATDLATLPASDAEAQRLLVLARYLAGETADVPEPLRGVTSSDAEALAAWQAVKDLPAGAALPAIPPPVLRAAPRLHAAVLARDGRWDEALAVLPQSPETAIDRAIALAWLDRLDESRALVTEALVRDPADVRALALRDVLARFAD